MTLRLLLSVGPLMLTALFGWLVMEGYLDFGGGDKDILFVLPPLLWSLLYLCSQFFLWWRRATVGRALALSAGVATGLMAVAWLVLASVRMKGILM